MEMLTYDDIKEQIGQEPEPLPETPQYQIIDETGKLRTFDNLENATRIKDRTNNQIETITYSKQVIEKNKKDIEDYYAKVNQVWFAQLCEHFSELDPETLRLLYNNLIEFSIEDQGYFDPDEIADRIDLLLPVFDNYFDHVLGTVGEVRKAFYFKESKNKTIKL
jgi:hypothetical protein